MLNWQLFLTVFFLIQTGLIFCVLFLLLKKKSGEKELQLEMSLFKQNLTSLENNLNSQLFRQFESNQQSARSDREEVIRSIQQMTESLRHSLADFNTLQNNHMDTFASGQKEQLDRLYLQFQNLHQDNNVNLDKIRLTVEEKLQATLEQRLGDSFKIVSDRLERVHQGIGEMQSLASGVGDLKKIFMNIKTKGILGEVQLESILEDIMTSDQFEKNVATRKNSNNRVEFALKIPSKTKERSYIWLPVDAKFPTDDYLKMAELSNAGDMGALDLVGKQFELKIKQFAKDIRDKYIDSPHTTDFAIMFIPAESIYAEILKRNLADVLRREYSVIVSGPMTLAALLNSLQMGFRTLAVEKRSVEVWKLLSAVKSDFVKFADLLDKTQKKLEEASSKIGDAAKRSNMISNKLKHVEEMPQEIADDVLSFARDDAQVMMLQASDS